MSSVIVLNQNFDYWDEAPIRRVMSLWLKNKIEIVKSDETKEYGSFDIKIKMPLIVRLLNFVGYKSKYNVKKYSHVEVFKRDNNICQFWHFDDKGRRFKYRCTVEDRTIDHLTPQSRGGKDSYLNCVCACVACNNQVKKNRTPEEAGLQLVRKPFVPVGGEMVIGRFAYDPKKLSHKVFFEEILGIKFSHEV